MDTIRCISKRMLAVLLTVMVLLSMVTIGITTASAATVDMVETGATITSGQVLYLSPSIWNKDEAWYALRFYNGSSNAWVKMTDADGNGVYEGSAPSGNWDSVIFCRMNGSKTALEEDSIWNQTGKQTFDGTKNLFTISDWGAGSWSVYDGSSAGGSASSGSAKFWVDTNANIDYAPDAIDILKPYEKNSTYYLYLPAGTDTDNLMFYANKEGITINGTKIATTGTAVSLKADGSTVYTVGGASLNGLKLYQSTVPAFYTITEESLPVNKGYSPEDGYNKDDYESEDTAVKDSEGNVISNSQFYAMADTDGKLMAKTAVLKKVKGRGNSSWEASAEFFGKYAFNITLDKKADLVGNDGSKSKKYCLVSFNADEARMRNMIIFGLSQEIGVEFVADYSPVDLYNNNKYIGTYLLTDKVEIGDPLVNLTDANGNEVNLDDINAELKVDGVLVNEKICDKPDSYRKAGYIDTATYNTFLRDSSSLEHTSTAGYFKYVAMTEPDADIYKDSGFLLEFELNERFADEISGFISNKGQQIVVKYPEVASKNEVMFIMGKWNEAEKLMYNSSATYEQLDKVIDVESFAKMYLIQELTKNVDAAATSFYVFYNEGKLHAGCSWDFDWALGQYYNSRSLVNESSSSYSSTSKQLSVASGWWARIKQIYAAINSTTGVYNAQAALCHNEAFWNVVQAEWNESFKPAIDAYVVSSSKTSSPSDLKGKKIYDLYTQMHATTLMDESRWGFISSNPLASWGSKDTGSNHDSATVWLNDFIYDRVKWMNDNGLESNTYDIQPPVISADKAEYKAGETVTLTIEDKTTGSYSYTIYNGSKKVGEGNTFTATESGKYTVKAKSATTGKESELSNAVTITVTAACDHVNVKTLAAVDATCTNTGLTEGKECTDCGEVLVKQTVVPALAHTEVIIDAEAPDCTNTGLTEGKYCSVCNEVLVKQEVVDELGHTVVIDKAVAPDCKNTGLTEGTHCSACKEVFVKQEVVAALGHTEVVDKAVEPDCKNTGLTEGKHCSVCKEVLVKQDVVAALGHTEKAIAGYAATCTEDGLTDGIVCSVCGETVSAQKTIPATGHTEETVKGYAATCTKDGLTDGTKCSVCGEFITAQKVIPATGHTWNNGSCTICGEKDKASSEISGYTVSLGGNIGINFYFSIDEAEAHNNTYVKFTLPNGSAKKVYFTDAEKTEDGKYYTFTCEVAAKEMASEVKAQLVTYTGSKSEVYTYSVQQYAADLLKNSENKGAYDLVKAMLNYGAAAQEHFKYNTSNLANSILPEKDREVAVAEFKNNKYQLTGKTNGVSYYGSRLTLESETAIKHYFVVGSGVEVPEFKVDGKAVTVKKVSGMYEVKITDIPAQNLDKYFEVTVGDVTLNYSVFSYAHLVSMGNDTALKDVMNAMYAYNQIAKEYVKTNNG